MWSESVSQKTKSIDGECSKTALRTVELATEIEPSEMNEMIGQGALTSHVKALLLRKTSLGVELPPREELVGNAKFLSTKQILP